MKKVLFVCTGNTCRSPMAEALLKEKMPTMEVRSAGVHVFPGSQLSKHAQVVLQEKGIAFSHEPAPVNEKLLEWAEVILTMTTSHKELLLTFFPHVKGRVYTLKEVIGDSSMDVSDPFGGDVQMYRQTLNELEDLIDKWIEKNQG